MSTIRKQVIAMGGGGFSMEPGNKRLDQYILNQSNKKKPRICLIPTASGDSKGYIKRFYNCFSKMNCAPTHLSLFKPNFDNLESFILNQDIIYVGGGNTRNLLLLWKDWELDKILKKAYKKGVILTGLSAGSICWFEDGITDPLNAPLYKLNCLGIIKGSHCPHYDGEAKRRPAYHLLIKSGKAKPGFAMDDGAAIHFFDGKVKHAISSRKKAKAYRVTIEKQKIKEEILETHYLKVDGNLN